MKITNAKSGRRGVWVLDNDSLALTVMQGGGHIAGLRAAAGHRVNPFWAPAWKTIEPWQYRPADAARYGSKLLASISGHNLCLGAFGDPSPEEARAGLGCHGEAPVVRWKALERRVSGRRLTFVCGCDMPIAQMRLVRRFSMEKGSHVIRVQSRLTNMARRDVPFTMCEHVTFGPPFLERDVTVFDMPATLGHTFPGAFSDAQRLKSDAAFRWPDGPGQRGKLDLRVIGRMPRRSSDFSTQLMNPALDHAWFSALNPRLRLAVVYVWRRSDFPWLGNWEESYGRPTAPWNGVSLTRGMEFANTPFPVGLRRAVDMGSFHQRPTFRWLPALSTLETEFSILAFETPARCKGVACVTPEGGKFRVDLMA